jgi:hypothetical protein
MAVNNSHQKRVRASIGILGFGKSNTSKNSPKFFLRATNRIALDDLPCLHELVGRKILSDDL